MNNLSIKELKDARILYKVRRDLVAIAIIDELIAILELKGDQVPVAEIKFHPSTDKHPCMYWFGKQDRDFPVGTQFFTAPQKPVVPDDATVLDWGERNDIKGDVSRLRCLIDDAATLPATIGGKGAE